MFEELSKYRVIFVTGPQRSGTRICTHMIAHDTGHVYIDEGKFEVDNVDLFAAQAKLDKVVIHCPGMSYRIEDFAARHDALTVFMRRPLKEIQASEERIGWIWEENERSKYDYHSDDVPVSLVKKIVWATRQRPMIPHTLDQDYHGLVVHPLWVKQKHRTDWRSDRLTVADDDNH